MPHLRNRHIEQNILKSLKWSPVVGLYGLRQVGKTTLARHLIKSLGGDYESFDSAPVLAASEAAPIRFLTRNTLLCLDEAQKAPWIFSAIKDIVGIARKPTRFLLTGSIRFTLKQDIRESLTGRIVMHEILPFSLAESHQKAPSLFLKTAISTAKTGHFDTETFTAFAAKPRFSSALIQRYAAIGGMPIPCFSRNPEMRTRWYEDYFETLILRDLELADPAIRKISYRQGRALLNALQRLQGHELNMSVIARESLLAPGIVKNIIAALEALGLIDLILPLTVTNKSLRKPNVQWKDIGLWQHLSGSHSELESNFTATELCIAQEFRSQTSQLPTLQWNIHKTRDSSLIPWIFSDGSLRIAIIWRPEETPAPMAIRTLKQFVDSHKNHYGIVLGPTSSRSLPLDERILLIPYPSIF